MKRIQDFSFRHRIPLLVFAAVFLGVFLLLNIPFLPQGGSRLSPAPDSTPSSMQVDTSVTSSGVALRLLRGVAGWMVDWAAGPVVES